MNSPEPSDRIEAPASSRAQNMARLRAMQDLYLPKMMRLCATAHPYYMKVFAERGLSPQDFKTVEDIRKLPMLPKQVYIDSPEMFRLDLAGLKGLSPEEATLADVIYTSGSTGSPVPFYDTTHDRFARVHHLERVSRIAGIGPGDTVMNLFPLSSVPHQGFLSATWGAMAVGARLLAGLTGRIYEEFPVHNRMDHVIDMIEKERPTVLWGITTYVRRLLLRAQELGKNFSSVRLVMVMGEPCPGGMRDDIRERLRAMGSHSPTVNNGYGFTESQGPAIECVEFGGMHQAVPDQFYFEVVDPHTGDLAPDGESGMVLLSHLNRRGTVLLRYVVGDIVAMTHETCPHCGRWEPRFLGRPYRADGLTKVKGTLINPASVLDRLSRLFRNGVAEYQIVITREVPGDPYSPDALVLRLACNQADRERLVRDAQEAVRGTVDITPVVEFLPVDAFSEIAGGYKFRRFVDRR